MLTMSRLSTEYVQVPVSFTVDGQAQDPTADKVEMAFTRPGALPVSGDWHTGSWDTAGSTYRAQCLVGPAGGVSLAPGLYNVWVRITDTPEVPVRSPAQLTIT